jgi:Rrf2 family protein
MLRLTKKADYGLMALKFLAERSDTPSLSAKDIAEAYGIPPQLLAKILQRLTKVGLLKSHAGTNGGYALSRPPEDITAFEVIGAIDGPLFITSCETGSRGCDLTDSCTVREPLRKVNESITGVLKAIRVSDLCEPENARKPHGRPLESILVTLGR